MRNKVDARQFAYISGSGKGTVTALTSMQLHTLDFLDSESGGVRIAAVDLSKAFDCVTHATIHNNACMKFDLPREVIKLIVSYLKDRTQRVKVNNNYSRFVSVSSGVPQGRVVGPILFALVIDSFSNICGNSVVFKYADDITSLHFLRDDVDDDLQSEFDTIQSWCHKNKLTINHSKSCVLDVVTKKSLTCKPVHMSGTPVTRVSQIKILGCIFSANLKWDVYVDYLIKVASKRVYLILSLKRAV